MIEGGEGVHFQTNVCLQGGGVGWGGGLQVVVTGRKKEREREKGMRRRRWLNENGTTKKAAGENGARNARNFITDRASSNLTRTTKYKMHASTRGAFHPFHRLYRTRTLDIVVPRMNLLSYKTKSKLPCNLQWTWSSAIPSISRTTDCGTILEQSSADIRVKRALNNSHTESPRINRTINDLSTRRTEWIVTDKTIRMSDKLSIGY